MRARDSFACGMALGGLSWNLMVEDFAYLPTKIVCEDKKHVRQYAGKGIITSGNFLLDGSSKLLKISADGTKLVPVDGYNDNAKAFVFGGWRTLFFENRRVFARACMELNTMQSGLRQTAIEIGTGKIIVDGGTLEARFDVPHSVVSTSSVFRKAPQYGSMVVPFLALTPQALKELQNLLLRKGILHKSWLTFIESNEFQRLLEESYQSGLPVFLYSRIPMRLNKNKKRSLDLVITSFPVFHGTVDELRLLLTVLFKKVQNIFDFYLYGNKYWKKFFVVWSCLIRDLIYDINRLQTVGELWDDVLFCYNRDANALIYDLLSWKVGGENKSAYCGLLSKFTYKNFKKVFDIMEDSRKVIFCRYFGKNFAGFKQAYDNGNLEEFVDQNDEDFFYVPHLTNLMYDKTLNPEEAWYDAIQVSEEEFEAILANEIRPLVKVLHDDKIFSKFMKSYSFMRYAPLILLVQQLMQMVANTIANYDVLRSWNTCIKHIQVPAIDKGKFGKHVIKLNEFPTIYQREEEEDVVFKVRPTELVYTMQNISMQKLYTVYQTHRNVDWIQPKVFLVNVANMDDTQYKNLMWKQIWVRRNFDFRNSMSVYFYDGGNGYELTPKECFTHANFIDFYIHNERILRKVFRATQVSAISRELLQRGGDFTCVFVRNLTDFAFPAKDPWRNKVFHLPARGIGFFPTLPIGLTAMSTYTSVDLKSPPPPKWIDPRLRMRPFWFGSDSYKLCYQKGKFYDYMRDLPTQLTEGIDDYNYDPIILTNVIDSRFHKNQKSYYPIIQLVASVRNASVPVEEFLPYGIPSYFLKRCWIFTQQDYSVRDMKRALWYRTKTLVKEISKLQKTFMLITVLPEVGVVMKFARGIILGYLSKLAYPTFIDSFWFMPVMLKTSELKSFVDKFYPARVNFNWFCFCKTSIANCEKFAIMDYRNLQKPLKQASKPAEIKVEKGGKTHV